MSTNGKPIPELTDAEIHRFWAKVSLPDGQGCARWMAGTDRGGYGRMKVADSMYRAHRISYTLANGPIPAGLVLDHLCRDSSCVTPAHLEAVTNKENIQRGESGTFNASKTHCAQGHEFTQENTYRGPSGQRHCRACGRNRNRKRSAQKRNKESQ